VLKTNGDVFDIDNPNNLPPTTEIAEVEEPFVDSTILVPSEYVGVVIELCRERRGIHVGMEYPTHDRVMVHYKLPLAEIVMDFYDALKGRTRGYASFDYELSSYEVSQLSKLEVMLNGEPVDALSFITHRDRAYSRAKVLVEKLKEVIPRQQYEVRIQATLGNKIIALDVKAYRKNVTAKCYGGDITRKRKLLEKAKRGQEAHESHRQRRSPAGSFYECVEDWGR